MNYTGCYAAVNSYFDKYRTVATGSISIGIEWVMYFGEMLK